MSTLRANQIQTTTGKPILNSTGSILQVVQTVKTDTWSISPANGTTFYPITGFTAAITPTSSSSKILVQGNLHLTTGYYEIQGKLTRNSSDISGALGSPRGSRTVCTFATNIYSGGTSGYSWNDVTFQYLDSPASISSQTYGISVNSYSTYALGLNISVVNDQDGADYNGQPISTITLMEISG
jgi:hypothetical protein